MARRCRLISGTADEFTKRRLLHLASKYEARLEGRSRPVTTITAATITTVKVAPSRNSGER
jgi:hypothetical protein